MLNRWMTSGAIAFTFITGILTSTRIAFADNTIQSSSTEKALTLAQAVQQSVEISQALPGELRGISGRLDGNSNTLDNGSYVNTHLLEGIEGQAIAIEMSSSDFDTYLMLIGPDSQVFAVNDDGDRSSGSNSDLLVKLPSTGTYQILARSSRARETGQYRLSWQILSPEEATKRGLPPSGYVRYEDLYSLPGAFPDASIGSSILPSSFANAIPLAEESVTVLRQQMGDNHPDVAAQLTVLAPLYLMQNRPEDARFVLAEAMEIYSQDPDRFSTEISEVQYFLSGAAYLSGDLNEAATNAEEALEIEREATSSNNSERLLVLNTLPGIYQAQGRYGEAEQLLKEQIEILRQQSEPLDLATAMDSLAHLYHIQERYGEAESAYKEALGIRRELSTSGTATPNSLNGLALLYQAQGRYEEAEDFYIEALSIREAEVRELSSSGLPNSQQFADNMQIYMAPIFHNLSGLYRVTGDMSRAIENLQEGLNIEERELELSLTNLGDADRLAYAKTISDTLNYALSLHLESALNSSEAAQLALTTVLRRKGRVLDAGAEVLELLRQSNTPENKEIFDNFVKLQQEIASLAATASSNLSSNEYRNRISRVRSEANRLEGILARRAKSLRAEQKSVDIADIQSRIPTDGVLVEYVTYRPFDPANPTSNNLGAQSVTAVAADNFGSPRYAAYLLFPDGDIKAVDLGEVAAIDNAIQGYGSLLKNGSGDFSRGFVAADGSTGNTRNAAERLKSLVLDPIAPYIKDQNHLLISPDGQLNNLPFESILTEDGRYLVEQYQVSYLDSGRNLLQLDNARYSNAPAVVMAAPEYGAANTVGTEATKIQALQFGPLPGTSEEANNLKPLLSDAVFYTDTEATENALKAVQSPSILHVATHGFFLPDVARSSDASDIGSSAGDFSDGSTTAEILFQDPLLRSGLAFSGFNPRSSGSEDGVLTALEAASLNLSGTQLVVLSACDTGLGDIISGEGVYGLRRAFSVAGAESQLISLWQVSDFGTQSLMTLYYQNLISGMGRSEALRAAQLEMIQSEGQYSHPYYWSAFVMTGDWRPLR